MTKGAGLAVRTPFAYSARCLVAHREYATAVRWFPPLEGMLLKTPLRRSDFNQNVGYVRAAMVNRMTYKDRVYFGTQQTVSDDIHAAYGVRLCTRTIRRVQSHLVATGEWKRDPDFRIKGKKLRTTAWRCAHGVLRKPKCPTTETSFPKNSKTYNTYGVGVERLKRVCEKNKRRRRGVGEVVPIGVALPLFENDTPARRNTAPGQALWAAVVAALPVPLPRSVIAVAVKHGSAALYDGVDPAVVLAGCLAALRQGKQRFASEIIADIALAVAGERMSSHQYRRELDNVQAKSNPVLQRISEVMSQIQADKEARKR